MNAPAAPPVVRPAVLLVDDELPLVEAWRLSLEAEFEVDFATDAAEAELLMAARRYAVVVSDHLMPGEAGLTFLTRAKTRYPHARRILITGYLNAELISRATNLADLSACLVKPVHLVELAGAIRRAANR